MFKHDVRILLVEDHPFQLMATQCLLNSYGFHQLTSAYDAESALRLMQQAKMPFEILLCDQCLPDLQGLELIDRASRQGLIQKAIILSSLTLNELDELKNQASERGLPLLGYLTKPLNHWDLKTLLICA
ncbi:response regulator transcription factor [Pseudomonas sp. H11T01]|uniref:response regulator transcription factor n=1 Tax=Pseudomonas sp. H11T01 TaxID=3402749 RepID=UPI003AC27D94